MSEKKVRDFVRENMPENGGVLSWVEPTRGSTIGAPDVLIPLVGRLVGVELKVGEWNASGDLRAVVRPSQIRWHRQMARVNVFSGVLFGVGGDHYFMAGELAGLPHYPRDTLYKIERGKLIQVIAQVMMRYGYW